MQQVAKREERGEEEVRAKALGWRVCSECGREKLLAKYYRHPNGPDGFMAHCKACHNGCTETIRRQAAEAMERQLGDPSEEQIAMQTAEIRAKWSDNVRERRRSRKLVQA